MPANASLDEYPALAKWYAENRPRTAHDLPELLVLGTCEALQREELTAVHVWVAAFHSFLKASTSPLQDFLVAEATIQRCDAELMDLIGDLGETAVRGGETDAFFTAMQAGAELTGLIVFRFLSAWTALNSGQPEACVEECEKVTEPFASVHTLHGQALLELGRPVEALEALNVATTLAPGELLAWFQKAKAAHVLGQHESAFAALKECQRLAPQSDEVALYMAMLAVETPHKQLWMDAWHALRPRLKRVGNLASVTLMLVRLGIFMDDKRGTQEVLAESPWSGDLEMGEITQTLTATLRQLGDKGWMDVASLLLGKVTTLTAC